MTPLRQRMIEDMQRCNFSEETQRNYIHYIAEYARHFKVSPDQLAPEAIREYQLFLTNDRKMSAQSVNCFTAAAKFLYQITLEMPWSQAHFVRSRVPETLPAVLSPTEVAQFFQAIGILKHRAVLMTCYGAGLRICEAVSLKVGDIDSSRMVIRVRQGKGAKDRYVNLPARLLTVLGVLQPPEALSHRARWPDERRKARTTRKSGSSRPSRPSSTSRQPPFNKSAANRPIWPASKNG